MSRLILIFLILVSTAWAGPQQYEYEEFQLSSLPYIESEGWIVVTAYQVPYCEGVMRTFSGPIEVGTTICSALDWETMTIVLAKKPIEISDE